MGISEKLWVPFRIVHPWKEWSLEPLSISSHFFYWLKAVYQRGQYLPTSFGAPAYGPSQFSQQQRKALRQKDTCATLKWDAATMTPSLPGTLHYSHVWNQRPGNVLWGSKNVKYKYPDVLSEGNSPSTWVLWSAAPTIPSAPITHWFKLHTFIRVYDLPCWTTYSGRTTATSDRTSRPLCWPLSVLLTE